MGRIALVNVPFHSHVAAMMRLAAVLAHQGHELIVWAPEEWRAQVEKLGARLEPSSPEIPRVSASRRAAEMAAATEREAERLIPQLHAHDVDLVLRDSQTPWALVAAQYLGIPRLVSHPMFPTPGSVDTDEAELDPVERERFDHSRMSIARRWGVELEDVRGLHHRTSEPTLTFTTEEIVGDHGLPANWHCIGPLLCPPPPGDRDRDPPLVFASFGTAQNRRTELFRIVIAAMARLPARALISAGGRDLSAEDLGPIPPNVTIEEFVSVREVLARARVQITHGGSNSVHESLIAAVPLVCLPQAFDQIPLSRRVVELGLGVISEQDPGAVADAVLAMIGSREVGARLDAISARLQHYDGEARVAAATAGSLGPVT